MPATPTTSAANAAAADAFDALAELATASPDSILNDREAVAERNRKRAVANERITMQHVIDQVPDYLWIKDAESRFVVVNKALAAGLWFRCDKRIWSAVRISTFTLRRPRAFSARVRWKSWRAGVRRPTSRRSSSPIRATANGSASTKAPLRDDNGEVFGLMGIARDITDARVGERIARRAGADSRNDRQRRAAGRRPRSSGASGRISFGRDIRLDLAARRRRESICAAAPRRIWRRAT